MLTVLLLQAASLLPPPAAATAAPDPAYRARLEAVLLAGEVPAPPPPDLLPQAPGQREVLRQFLLEGSSAQVRLAALLAADAETGSPLARALLHAGCELREEGAALAALLAFQEASSAELPALARLALEPSRPLAVRAAATGRLLEAGCGATWPLARSILRTGTALDEDAPWADWERSGRYELPKRILLLFVDAWLAGQGLPPSGYEPNAAWAAQAEQLQELEALAARARAADPGMRSVRGGIAMAAGLDRLLLMGTAGDERALRALAILQPYSAVFLVDSAAQAGTKKAAQRALELAPR